MSIMKQLDLLPPLFHKNSNGSIQSWTISVCDDAGVPCIVIEYGQLDGVKQYLYKHIREGKNIGKKNETTPLRQAQLEAASIWRKKKDKGYSETLEGIEESPRLPMLAHPYEDRKHNVEFPAYAQPKLEGVRCLATKISEEEVTYTSRQGKKFHCMSPCTPHYLKILQVGETVDGEIFNPRLVFEELVSYVKNASRLERDRVPLFHYVYDFPTIDGGFIKRYEELERRMSLITEATSPLVLVPTLQVDSHEEFLKLHRKFVEHKYEGSILRNASGNYQFDYRSVNLLKHKDFMDAEYEIIDVREARLGNRDGAVIFVCQCPRSGEIFEAVPVGSYDVKKAYLVNKDRCIGKLLTVRYQRLTERGVPYLPVGLAIRNYE